MSHLKLFFAREKELFAAIAHVVRNSLAWILLVLALGAGAALLLHFYDAPLMAWAHAHRNEAALEVARQLSRWGELHLAPLIALVILAFGGTWRKKAAWTRGAIAGVHAGVAAGILVNIAKFIAGRPRPSTPHPDGFHWFELGWAHASFPSGHATHCMAIVAAVALFAPRYAALLTFGAFAVIWSRWYTERHYPTDLLAGAVLGLVVGVIIALAARSTKAPVPRPVQRAVEQEVGR